MEPELIWPNSKIGVYIIFEEILALTRVRHIVSSKVVVVQTKCGLHLSVTNYLQILLQITFKKSTFQYR